MSYSNVLKLEDEKVIGKHGPKISLSLTCCHSYTRTYILELNGTTKTESYFLYNQDFLF